MLKRKLPAPKDGWKDLKGMTMYDIRKQMYDIFWKLRTMVRDQAATAPDASNAAKRAPGVRRANLSDPDDYAERLEAMSIGSRWRWG